MSNLEKNLADAMFRGLANVVGWTERINVYPGGRTVRTYTMSIATELDLRSAPYITTAGIGINGDTIAVASPFPITGDSPAVEHRPLEEPKKKRNWTEFLGGART